MYKHLTSEERHYIAIGIKQGMPKNKIAQHLNRSHSTIIREIKRNTDKRGYRYNQADGFAQQRHQAKSKFIKLTIECKRLIDNCLNLDWSPEQICGWLNSRDLCINMNNHQNAIFHQLDNFIKHSHSFAMTIFHKITHSAKLVILLIIPTYAKVSSNNITQLHHESIYRYLLKDKANGGLLYQHLKHQGRSYRKCYGYAHNRTGIPNRVDIDQRPEAVNNREVFGHWEADTIIGKTHKGAIVTLDERISKLRLAYPLNSKHKNGVSAAINTLLQPVKNFVHSITYDNGKEFAGHGQINKSIDCKSYFAKPYHSWERGQNEDANGLLRQYFPKTMSLINITYDEVKIAIDKLNSRPRKCLGFKTPYQVFFERTGIDDRQLGVVHL